MSITDDPSDPRIRRGPDGGDHAPVPQDEAYLVLSEAERGKGFVRPYRDAYFHAKDRGGCGTMTTMGRALSETYARQPDFYGATYCCGCRMHRPVGEDGEFVWFADGTAVGT